MWRAFIEWPLLARELVLVVNLNCFCSVKGMLRASNYKHCINWAEQWFSKWGQDFISVGGKRNLALGAAILE